jgi:hypothetical protein
LLAATAGAASLVVGAVPAVAGSFSGSSSNATETPNFAPEKIIAFAKKVEKTIAARGARVAIVARLGRPASEMPEGMRFTHVAFAVYSTITMKDGRQVPGYAMYNLYQDDGHPDRSSLVQDYPADFFGAVAELEAGVIVPSEALQARLLDVIASPTYAALHDPHYSVIANPFTLGRQNCTEFVLDVLNAAIYKTADINKIKEAEKAYFTAQPVKVNPFKLLVGAMFIEEVSMADQPGSPVTATFERIGEYLGKYDQGSAMISVLPDK